ncbi:hypothetical protein SAMN02745225_01122 [Ferrithrix thermotolerans DSM 19514]|uniref:Uncharacterized protein n=1 Tax=Ferrithrix thermotolerans DSM 19514 TaxID=1121881 RepID=A0A1M4UWE9_9ACTN|nr:hypothetical protein SAMN02745225_01122 [Ferrithrix thermotolerans DSM 19514]
MSSDLFLDGLPAAFVTLVEQVQIASGLVGFLLSRLHLVFLRRYDLVGANWKPPADSGLT